MSNGHVLVWDLSNVLSLLTTSQHVFVGEGWETSQLSPGAEG